MQLGRPSADARTATTLAEGLARASALRGHRPAITVLGAGPDRDRRDEQSFASLAQWVAKGAHLLEVDIDLGPGDAVLVQAPAGWMTASVCLAVWWVGATVTDDPSAAVCEVAHRTRTAPHLDGWLIGDAVDGTPVHDDGGEAWATAVQSFPDQPPPSRAQPDQVALRLSDGRELRQRDLLDLARALPAGRLGLRAPLALAEAAVQMAARAAATADPSVLVVEATAEQVAAERCVNPF